VSEILEELLDALGDDEGIESSSEQLAEYGAYINWRCPHISIEMALQACLEDDHCWASLLDWIRNRDRPKAGCDR
jgi:hypothetical protein